MAISLTCACGATIRVEDRLAGRLGECPQCGNKVRIPGGATPRMPEPPKLDTPGTEEPAQWPLIEVQRPIPRPTPKKVFRRLITVAVLALVSLALIAAVTVQSRRNEESRRLAERTQWMQSKIQEAETLILDKKDYAAAKAALDAAEPVAKELRCEEAIQTIATWRKSEEIRQGSQGKVRVEGQWLPVAMAEEWRKVRQRDDPQIQELETRALENRRELRHQETVKACQGALALIELHPARPHPREAPLRKLLLAAQNDMAAAEMTAKGLVLYADRWMTPQDKFRLEQEAKGLQEYKGQWLPKDDAFAAAQKDKGLVLHEGKWMTPDQKMQAQGFIQFEDKWVKPEEKAAVIAQRAEAARREKESKEREANRVAEAAAAAARLKEDAYLMSQVFIKKILKSPASARFQDYSSRDVIVVYKDGWFIVKAPVDSQNGYGALLRATYYCKLRPSTTKEGFWESQDALLDE